jgi:hypothetical protein
MRIFQELGRDIEQAWGRVGFVDDALPGIVTDTLHTRRLHRQVGLMDVFDWAMSEPDLPRQHDVHAIFAEPPISVYDGPRIHVQVLCWRSGTTAIHEHGFVGGFVVLEGTNLHTTYSFQPRLRISSRLQVGDVQLMQAELLSAGDIMPITHDLKHTIFHLEAPSATVVVRSNVERAGAKLDCFVPSLAFDPLDVDPVVLRRTQLLRLLLHTEHPRHDDMAADLLERADLPTTWDVLEQSHNEIRDAGRVARLTEIARRRHGAVVDDFVAVIDEQRRMQHTLRLHARSRDPQLRFFLALLHSLPDRTTIFDMVGRRYPEADPHDKVSGWATQLSGVDRIGIDLSDSANHALFTALLAGCSPAQALDRLRATFHGAGVSVDLDDVMAQTARFEQTVLAPLMRSPLGAVRARS